jgi:hypothetical protein
LAAARSALLDSLALVAVVLLARRFSGALVQPLGGGSLIAVAILGGVAAAIVRLTERQSFLHSAFRIPHSAFLFALPGLAAVLLLAAVTVSGSPVLGVLASWFLLVAAEGATWLLVLRKPVTRGAVVEADESVEFPPGLVQQVTRVLDDGVETVHAVLRAQIEAGDRQAIVHVAFCPPLAMTPELTAHAIDSEAEVKITQAESFGARLEVRLPAEACAEQAVLVELLGSVKVRSA